MSLGDDGSCFRNNVQNFVELVHKLRPCQKLIYASSSSVYSGSKGEKVDESYHKYTPVNHYDNSKMTIDNYASLFRKDRCIYGLRFGTVNGYSPNFRNEIMLNAMVTDYFTKGQITISHPSIHRPVLFINKLAETIESIIGLGTNYDSGVYNLASFNSTVEEIGLTAAKILDCPLLLKPGLGFPYDFSMVCDKQLHAFRNYPSCYIDDIVVNLRDNYSKIKNSSNRDAVVKYE